MNDVHQVQVEIPAARLEIPEGTTLRVERDQQGNRAVIAGPFLIELVLPMNPDAAAGIGGLLIGGVQPATVEDLRGIRGAA